jgi:hypothetical protein
VSVVVLLTFRDYGITWDEPRQDLYGRLALAYYRTLGTDRSLFDYFNLYLYGGAFDVPVALGQALSPLRPCDTRHLLTALVGLAGLLATWRLARELAGPRAGFLALTLLAATPDWYGHLFANPKDIPFAAAMTWALYGLVRVARTLPAPPARTLLGLGVSTGLAMGVRVGGGLVFLYAAALVLAWTVREAHGAGWAPAASRGLRAAVTLAPAGLVAWAIMLAFWPWAQQAPLANPLAAARTFSAFPQDTLFVFMGGEVRSTDLPLAYVPVMLAVRLPEPVLLGLAVLPLLAMRGGRPGAGWPALTLIGLAALFPLALVMATRAVLYDGLRHLLFALPPATVLAAAALDRAWDRLPSGPWRGTAAALGLGWAALQVGALVAVHPYQYVLYNHLAGGVAGAAGRFELDYWASSVKETSEALVARLVDREGPGVRERGLRVVVCGPGDSVRPYLPPAWEVIDWRADEPADLFVAVPKIPCEAARTGETLVQAQRHGAVFSSAGLVEPGAP